MADCQLKKIVFLFSPSDSGHKTWQRDNFVPGCQLKKIVFCFSLSVSGHKACQRNNFLAGCQLKKIVFVSLQAFRITKHAKEAILWLIVS